jgi:hypothetical protein
MPTYSNPRMAATIEDWPSGSKRVTARFEIETTKRGERGVRTTTGAAKKLTFARKARIVDGDDGKTYIAELTLYGHVSIMRGDFKYQEETIHPDNARYPAVMALFKPICCDDCGDPIEHDRGICDRCLDKETDPAADRGDWEYHQGHDR